MKTQHIHRLILPLLLITLITGCDRGGVYGVVTNNEGEALPGVSVRLTNNENVSDITNVLGQYRLNTQPGQYSIQYAKSGYTQINAELTIEESSSDLLPTIEMWNLPPSNSVFLYNNTLYTPTTWIKPKRYYMADTGPSFGTKRSPEVHTDESIPFIVCHKMPRYDARLSRLVLRQAQLPQDEKEKFNVWAPVDTMSVSLDPLVASDPSLLKVNLYAPLEPGRYALHWGALSGYTTIDDRIYMFEVIEKTDPLLDEAHPDLVKKKTGKDHIEGDAP